MQRRKRRDPRKDVLSAMMLMAKQQKIDVFPLRNRGSLRIVFTGRSQRMGIIIFRSVLD
jgi:hypothetical protein